MPILTSLKGLLFAPLALVSRASLLIKPEEGVVERMLKFTEGDLMMLFLLSPIAEELAFRGVLFLGLVLSGLSFLIAAIVSALIFLLAHAPMFAYVQLPKRLVLALSLFILYFGLLSAYITYFYGLAFSILAHSLGNSPYLWASRKRKSSRKALLSSMPKKRKNAGRKKGEKGRVKYVQCSICGRVIPEDKAIKRTVYVPLVPPELRQEIMKQIEEAKKRGEEPVFPPYIPVRKEVRYYCISCAIHHHIIKIRPKDERKPQGDLFSL